jgi:hypothetical protein
MEAKLVERFPQIDRELVENLALSASPLDETQEPTPSPAPAKSPAGKSSAESPKKSATR